MFLAENVKDCLLLKQLPLYFMYCWCPIIYAFFLFYIFYHSVFRLNQSNKDSVICYVKVELATTFKGCMYLENV